MQNFHFVCLFPNGKYPLLQCERLWFQQNSAKCSLCCKRQYLDQIIPSQLIGKCEPIEWPWSHLKNVLYKTRPNNVEELKEKITFKCGKINKEVIIKVQQRFIASLWYCQAQEGLNFEQLIKQFLRFITLLNSKFFTKN